MKTTQLLQTLAKGIENVFAGLGNPRIRFSLFVWEDRPDGKGTQANYVSNCQRPEVQAAIKEVIARWEKTTAQDVAITNKTVN